jgi:hypothetical protein
LPAVLADAERLSSARQANDFAAAAPLVAGVLRELRAHAESSDPVAGRALVVAVHDTATLLKSMGHIDLGYMAAERLSEVVARLEEPAYMGLAAYSRLRMLPTENRALGGRLAAASLDQPGLTTTPEACSTYGMIHLVSALADAVAGKESDAVAHLDEAAEVAESVGESERLGGFAGLNFGPANVAQWRAAIAIETGNPGRSIEISDRLAPESIRSTSRRAAFYVDRGTAFAQTHRDGEAVASFLSAEGLSPQWVRLNSTVRDTVGSMLRRSRAKAGGSQLQALAARVGAA